MYKTVFSPVTHQSSKMSPSERTVAFWTPLVVGIVALLGAVALPVSIAAMLP